MTDVRITPITTSASRSYNVVSLVAYLIGVPERHFGTGFQTTTYETLNTNPDAQTIRALCTVRNTLMKHFPRINNKLTYDLTNIDKMPEYIDPAIFSYLLSQGISIIKPNRKVVQYIADLNQHIANRINACEKLFPLWVKWAYIRPLFLMSGKEEKITLALKTYANNTNRYPFQCYIDWPVTQQSSFTYSAADTENTTNGNILHHDAKFLTLLYKLNHDTFTENYRVKDISENTRNAITDFVTAHEKIAMIVDCENSDPYRLTAALRSIQEFCGTDRIEKIILFDDPHTVDTWRVLSDYISTPIEHVMVDRVNEHKSLVDVRMTAGACKEHYTNGVDAFLLASSDSDFWALISALPTASFLVLAEKEKLGQPLIEAMNGHGTPFCFIDQFAGNLVDIKTGVIKSAIQAELDKTRINTEVLLSSVIEKSRLSLSAGERKVFFEQYVKSIKAVIGSDGVLRLVMKE